MQTVTIGHVVHYVRDEGDPQGRPIVLANALGTDLRVWDAVLPLLPANLRILRYDKRGHGLSDGPPGPWTIDDLAADLAAILDARGIRDAAIVGLSIGGLVAQVLAARRPDLVRVLVLSNTAAKIGTAEAWDARIAAVETGGIAAVADAVLERWFTPGFRADPGRLAPWRNMLLRTPRAGYVAASRAVRDADLTASTRTLAQPTLVLAGDADGSTPPDLVRATADLVAGARFEVIPGAGHLPGVERPEAVARLLSGFLAETGHS